MGKAGLIVNCVCQGGNSVRPAVLPLSLHLLVPWHGKSHFTMAFGGVACELKASTVYQDYLLAFTSFKATRILTHFSIDPC